MNKELTDYYRSSISCQDAFSSAINALERAERENVFPVKVNFRFDNQGMKIFGKGKGFEISLKFNEKDLDLFLDLSFLLKPAKGKIISSIENELSKYL